MSLLERLFKGKKADDPAIVALYRRIVEQSRSPVFFRDLGVADTPEGRFDLLALHAFLVMEALSQKNPIFAQELFDLMFDDMDANLRELGVSDIRIGSKVRKLAQDFMGRSQAYRQALTEESDETLMAALDRNLYANTPSDPLSLRAIAGYMRAARSAPQLADGVFPLPPQPEKG